MAEQRLIVEQVVAGRLIEAMGGCQPGGELALAPESAKRLDDVELAVFGPHRAQTDDFGGEIQGREDQRCLTV